VQKLAFAIFKNLKFIEFPQPMLSLKPHQQAGALRFWVFQHALWLAKKVRGVQPPPQSVRTPIFNRKKTMMGKSFDLWKI
jgi:hypothetical protein